MKILNQYPPTPYTLPLPTPQKKVHLEDSKTRVYLWRIHFDVWQNQYIIVKLKNKVKLKKKKRG